MSNNQPKKYHLPLTNRNHPMHNELHDIFQKYETANETEKGRIRNHLQRYSRLRSIAKKFPSAYEIPENLKESIKEWNEANHQAFVKRKENYKRATQKKPLTEQQRKARAYDAEVKEVMGLRGNRTNQIQNLNRTNRTNRTNQIRNLVEKKKALTPYTHRNLYQYWNADTKHLTKEQRENIELEELLFTKPFRTKLGNFLASQPMIRSAPRSKKRKEPNHNSGIKSNE